MYILEEGVILERSVMTQQGRCYEQPPRYYSFPFPVILLFDHHGLSHVIVFIYDVSHAIVFRRCCSLMYIRPSALPGDPQF